MSFRNSFVQREKHLLYLYKIVSLTSMKFAFVKKDLKCLSRHLALIFCRVSAKYLEHRIRSIFKKTPTNLNRINQFPMSGLIFCVV